MVTGPIHSLLLWLDAEQIPLGPTSEMAVADGAHLDDTSCDLSHEEGGFSAALSCTFMDH